MKFFKRASRAECFVAVVSPLFAILDAAFWTVTPFDWTQTFFISSLGAAILALVVSFLFLLERRTAWIVCFMTFFVFFLVMGIRVL